MPVISGLSYTTTDTTIVAVWTTDVSSNSNLSVGGKAAIDNGVAANSTSHQCIVTGLSPSTTYSCFVTSGGTNSSSSNVSTAAAPARIPILSVAFGSATVTTPDGDILYNFLSNDGNTYMTRDDATTPGTGANQQLDLITNESTLAISQVNALTNYGGYATSNGTDGPGGVALSNKFNGLFGMGGSLYGFTGRHYVSGNTHLQLYGNVIQSNDHGATWNNFTAPSTFNANGNPPYPPSPAPYFFGNNSSFGWVAPVRYAADDGTLGYNTAGNQIDGANGFVYFMLIDGNNDSSDYVYLGRIPRIQLAALNYTACQFWIGPVSPSPQNFVEDGNWQTSASGLTKMYSNTGKCGWPDMVFVPAINRYVMNLSYRANPSVTSITTWLILEAPTPAGPWTQVGTQTNNPTGYYCQTVLHRTASTNVLTDSIALKLIYNGDYANATYYHPTYSTLTLFTTTHVANTFIQGKAAAAASSGTSAAMAYTSNVTSGNLLVLVWRYNGSGAAHLSTVTDTLTDSWTIVYDQNDGGATPIQGGWAYTFAKSTGANTVTMNFDTSVVGVYQCIGEWNGPTALRASSTVAVTNQTSLVSNAVTAVAGDLLIAASENGAANTNSFTAGSGYTLREQGGLSPTFFSAIEDNLSAAGGSTTASFTSSQNSSSVKATVGLGAFLFQQVATTTFSPTAGAYGPSQTVTFNNTNSGASGFAMYYTTDGSTPTTGSTLYSAPITVSSTQTVKVLAIATGYANSAVASATYTINGAVATTTFSPVAGSYSSAQTVTFNNTNSGLAGFAMYYTVDGSTPTVSSTLYSAPISVSSTKTVKVLAVATDYSNSAVASAAYTITISASSGSLPVPFFGNSVE